LDDLHRIARERHQFASGKVLFSQLDEIDASRGGLADFPEQCNAPRDFVTGELGSIRDVVKQQLEPKPLRVRPGNFRDRFAHTL
jgi:hypothetical protein